MRSAKAVSVCFYFVRMIFMLLTEIHTERISLVFMLLLRKSQRMINLSIPLLQILILTALLEAA